ncbi:MAG: alanine racemase [Actinomycetota bacterium]
MTDISRATAVLTVDLDAVVANWRLLAAKARPAEAAAVVKADAYGLGADKVAPALFAAGCRRFFVATIDEGLELRRVLPEGEVFVLCGPLPGSEPEFARAGLTPVLNSLEQIALWSAFAPGSDAVVHVDTGMSRLGLTAADLDRVDVSRLKLALVMSHMACADEAGSTMNAGQLRTFRAMAARLPQAPLSLAASSAIFLGAGYHFDLVRPGAALYGVNPTPDAANPMAQVVRLQGKILQVRDVDTPQTVGYGATHRVAGPARIATVAVGYADGWFRSLGNRGHGIIGGVKVPVAGRISMDLTTFDVTAAPAEAVHAGAMIDLLGDHVTVDTVAGEAGTIGYEVLTALGRRYLRQYRGCA